MLSSGGSILARQAGRGAGGPCDRACLQGFVEQYLDAWIARDPAPLPLAPNVKYTENGQRLELGDGSWKVGTGKGKYRLWVPDTQTGQVAVITTVTEDGAAPGQDVPSMLALRLKVVNRQISEAEALFVRPAAGGGGRGAAPARGNAPGDGRATPPPPPAVRLETMGAPNALFTQPTPPAERMSRADLIRIADMYFTGMQQNDGLGNYPFTDDCERFENASSSTNNPVPPSEVRADPKTASTYSSQWGFSAVQVGADPLCSASAIADILRIRNSAGLQLRPSITKQADAHYTRSDGRVITEDLPPWTWEIAELFRVEKSQIRRIEAVLTQSPYGQQWAGAHTTRACPKGARSDSSFVVVRCS
jgi:hypothetical protein